MSIPHLPSMQDTRRIQSMQPSLSITSSLRSRDQDLEDHDQTGYDNGLQDSPMVPILRIPQPVEEAHVVPLPDAEEDDKKTSTSHHVYDESDFWPWAKRNTAILTDAVPEPSLSSMSPSVDDKVDPNTVVDIGPSSSAPLNIVVEDLDHEQAFPSSYLPDMTTPSSGSTNGDGTENTDPAVSIIASEDDDGHDKHGGPESGAGERGNESKVPPSPAPSDVPEMPVFLPARNSTVPPEKHGGIGSFVGRKSFLFKTSNSSHDRRSSMPLPSAMIASLLPWRGSRRPSSEPELPSQSSKAKSRLSSSLPSPH